MAATDRADFEAVSFGSPRFRTLEAGGMLVTDARFPPGAFLPPHVHDRTCVATTLEGSFDSRMRGRSHWSTASMVLTEPAGERHDNRIGTAGARVLIVQPDASRLETLRPFSSFLSSIRHSGELSVSALARRLSLELSCRDAVTALAVEGLGLELLATAARAFPLAAAPAIPAWCRRVRERLHDHWQQPPTLAELSAIAGVHPGHLTREFRRHYGCSAGTYLRRRRLDWAAERLARSDEPLAAIAASAGFADQSHFTRQFRAQFGCTPAAFRRSGRLR